MDLYKNEFEKCSSLKDFENYVIKHYDDKNNPYLERAKHMISVRTKYKLKKRILITTILFVIIGILQLPLILSSGTTIFDWIFMEVCCLVFLIIGLLFLFNKIEFKLK